VRKALENYVFVRLRTAKNNIKKDLREVVMVGVERILLRIMSNGSLCVLTVSTSGFCNDSVNWLGKYNIWYISNK
jgi:hypothetical protein